MKTTSFASLWVAYFFLSSTSHAQIVDQVGDVAKPCVDIVETAIAGDHESISASVSVAGDFCRKAQYQLHVDVNGDGQSDYGYMARVDNWGNFTFHGSAELEVTILETENTIIFNFPKYELVDEFGRQLENISLWFRTHVATHVDRYPDKLDGEIVVPTSASAFSVIGPMGGQIFVDETLSDIFGAGISVPADALTEPTAIAIRQSTKQPNLSDTDLWAGPLVEFGPSGLQFALPVDVYLPFNDLDDDGKVDGTDLAEALIEVSISDDLDNWRKLPIVTFDSISNVSVAQVEHFSAFTTTIPVSSKSHYWDMDSLDEDDPDWLEEGINNSKGQWQFGFSTATDDGDNKALRIYTLGNEERERAKVRTRQKFGPGITIWKVFVPFMTEGDQASIGAFLHGGDDTRELDFEIASGKYWRDRVPIGADGTSDVLIYMTSQNQSISATWRDPVKPLNCSSYDGKCSVYTRLEPNRWYQLSISVELYGSGRSKIFWFVNGVSKVTQIVSYSSTHYIINSMEELEDFGDRLPTKSYNADFDSVSFYPYGGGVGCPCAADPAWHDYLASGSWTHCVYFNSGYYSDGIRLSDTNVTSWAASIYVVDQGYTCVARTSSGQGTLHIITADQNQACNVDLQNAADAFGTVCRTAGL